MAAQPTFNTGVKIALEATVGAAPSGASSWFQGTGGRWHQVPVEGLPDMQNRMAVIMPPGLTGRRVINPLQAAPGRRWSEGGFSGPVTADFLGVLLRAALGSGSTNSVPSTTASLLGIAEVVNTDPKSFVLTNQPSDSGAILAFEIKLNNTRSGTISVCGVDAYGNGASELISIQTNGMFYSRNAYSAIGGSSIAVSGLSGGSLTITGFQRFVHNFSLNSSGQTLSMDVYGDPEAGAASRMWRYTGLNIKELTLNTPAQEQEGLFTVDAQFEGLPSTAACTAETQLAASMLRLWPAWSLTISKNNTAWNKVTDGTFTINAGGRNYFAANGAQGPQGNLWTGVEVTGNVTILVDTEEELNSWIGSSATTLRWLWNTPWKLTGTQNYQLGASNVVFLKNHERGEDDGALTLSMDFSTVDDSGGFGPTQFQLQNGCPPGAYNI